MSYGTKLRTIRDKRNLSQQQVADFVGVANNDYTVVGFEVTIESNRYRNIERSGF